MQIFGFLSWGILWVALRRLVLATQERHFHLLPLGVLMNQFPAAHKHRSLLQREIQLLAWHQRKDCVLLARATSASAAPIPPPLLKSSAPPPSAPASTSSAVSSTSAMAKSLLPQSMANMEIWVLPPPPHTANSPLRPMKMLSAHPLL